MAALEIDWGIDKMKGTRGDGVGGCEWTEWTESGWRVKCSLVGVEHWQPVKPWPRLVKPRLLRLAGAAPAQCSHSRRT